MQSITEEFSGSEQEKRRTSRNPNVKRQILTPLIFRHGDWDEPEPEEGDEELEKFTSRSKAPGPNNLEKDSKNKSETETELENKIECSVASALKSEQTNSKSVSNAKQLFIEQNIIVSDANGNNFVQENKQVQKSKNDLNKENICKRSNKENDSFDLDFFNLSSFTPVKQKDNKPHPVPPDKYVFATPKVNLTVPKKEIGTPIVQYSTKKVAVPYLNNCNIRDSQFERLEVNGISYIILNMIGKGGSSEVFACYNVEKKMDVAIKCATLSNAQSAKGHINEVKLLYTLQKCDRIISMFDYQILESEKKMYVVLERCGEDFATVLKQLASNQRHIPVYMLLFYWLEMLYAVRQIHMNGIIHSDLKPANFLRAKCGLKLIDFGIAMSVQNDMTCAFKSAQEGSCNYISPEALKSETNTKDGSPKYGDPKYKVHFKSDVWSLGCILYQLIYRKTPFQHINQLWPKLCAIMDPEYKISFPPAPWVPQRFIETTKRCLKHDVRQRPSVDELIKEYEDLLHNL